MLFAESPAARRSFVRVDTNDVQHYLIIVSNIWFFNAVDTNNDRTEQNN